MIDDDSKSIPQKTAGPKGLVALTILPYIKLSDIFLQRDLTH